MAESIKQKTINGTFWSGMDNVANQGILFLVGLVLARLLSPKEYGLIGYIMVLIFIFESIVECGFSNALIRKKEVRPVDYNTTFIFNMVLSASLFAVMWTLALPFSRFFEEPQLIPLVRAMSSILIINAFSFVQRTVLLRKIDFKTQTKASLIASILSGIISIVMAFSGFGVWSLVAQQIGQRFFNTLFLWVFNHWRPQWEYSWESFWNLFGFGWKLLVSSLIDTIWREGSRLIVGKCYSTAALGQYTRAQQFSTSFSVNMANVFRRVSYPVLSSIQDEHERMKEAYRQIIRLSMLVSFVFMFGMAAVAKPLILSLIGEQWLPAVFYLQLLCFSSCLQPLNAINLNILQVKGRSDWYLKLEIVKKIIAVGPLLLGVFVSLEWMLYGLIFVSVIHYALDSYYSGSLMGYSVWAQVKDILPSFFMASVMALLVYPLSLLAWSSWLILSCQLLLGFLLVVLMGEVFRVSAYVEMKDIVSGYIKQLRKK